MFSSLISILSSLIFSLTVCSAISCFSFSTLVLISRKRACSLSDSSLFLRTSYSQLLTFSIMCLTSDHSLSCFPCACSCSYLLFSSSFHFLSMSLSRSSKYCSLSSWILVCSSSFFSLLFIVMSPLRTTSSLALGPPQTYQPQPSSPPLA